MRVLVTGNRGQVVSSLLALNGLDNVEIIALGRPELDLANLSAVEEQLATIAPDVVVSAAAYTAVDKAESEQEIALAVNATGPGALAAAAAARDIPILHLSTDYVFAGNKATPYREDDPTGPTGVYGATKLAGEKAVAAANPRHVILRTAWVYSVSGQNFVNTMLRLSQTRDVLNVVSDQHGSPTFSDDIAAALLDIARQVQGSPADDGRFGIYHMTGGGDTSWAGFATAIFDRAARSGRPAARVVPISTAEYPLSLIHI